LAAFSHAEPASTSAENVLTEILRDEGEEHGINEYAATARAESGSCVMSARISITITDQ
jgi:hypothetical protein